MYETFSYRQRQRERKAADVFTYDELPYKLRVQAARIWSDALEEIFGRNNVPNSAFEAFHELITTELGVYTLGNYDQKRGSDITSYFISTGFEEALDILEMMFFGMSVLTIVREKTTRGRRRGGSSNLRSKC
jgi:hypothetical protein